MNECVITPKQEFLQRTDSVFSNYNYIFVLEEEE